ncbi:pre-peptidase C-terminal domain-containing protein [Pleionea sp. CnH1-48]|uniref:pre-peptidase C-terminal domain-containing protein n=1 Tax=Pleionea sp. CnH1-48 TaxID=2954494 RepID=UPI0020981F6B|nr:pre-peptidase C-terminal domain-containing protein [Pleionea sp. CnH1-48]MCO7225579.1 pre-peptidase C-terminal domain-containing protein [Pleionea sp. CnH1-48]
MVTMKYLSVIAATGIIIAPSVYAQKQEVTEKALRTQSVVQAAKPNLFKALITNKSLLKTAHNYRTLNAKKITIQKSDASFIKLHFSNFDIPAGSYVEVRNKSGSQIHRYGGQASSLYTLQPGDDGIRSFSALSIIGDTAVVEWFGPESSQQPYHIEIDSFMGGLNKADLAYNQSYLESSDIAPMSTCGINERVDVQCWADSHPTEYERTRPVARLLINGSGLCTAWRVGENNRLFTNNHCVSGASGVKNLEVWFNYQNTECSSGSSSTPVIVTGDELLSTNSDLDYTLFTVKNFETIQSFGHFGLDVRNPIEQERIYIPQHGSGDPKQLAIESDENSDGLCRVDVTLADGSAPNTDMGYMCDTTGGSSGSPVLAVSSHNVLALHHFGGCPNQGVLINKIWPKVTTFFNHQIPVGDNGTPSGQPVANFDVTANALEVNFTDTSADSNGQITYHQWHFGDGQSSNQKSPTHVYASAGNYSVNLEVTDNDGNKNSNSQIISITNNNNGALQKGVATENLNASIDKELLFYFDVPDEAQTLTINTYDGDGDADLYVQFGEHPNEDRYDCRPYLGGNRETCRINSPRVGRYYVLLKAYRAFSGVSLLADYTSGSSGVSFEENNVSDSTGSWKHYSLLVPEGMTKLVGKISNGTGDADLYVRRGEQPTNSSYQCRPYKNGNNETCTISNPESGLWYFSIKAYSSYSGVSISGEAN